jgi:histone acetyltransferase 1
MSTTLSKKLLHKLESYKADANQCTHIKYIYNEADIHCDSDVNPIFKPEFTHQIFGDDELIFGFKNLTINYYLTPGLMHAYIGLSYAEKITPQRFEGIEPDDVYEAIQKFGCSPGFTRNLDLFCSDKLKQDREFRPFGKKIHEYSTGLDSSKKYEVYKVDLTCGQYSDPKFIEYLQRVQTMLVFFIETADFTDTDDDQWVYYFLYEKRSAHGPANESYSTIGFTSVYNYYAYPDKKRTRISQMLIMPPYQKGGHGAQLMESIYNDAVLNPEIIDVTAEAPSVNFIKLRDFVTCCMCMQLESCRSAENLKKGFSVDMVVEALRKFKLPKLQTRRCYEILRLQVTNQNNALEYRDYRLDIKKRLFMPFIRNVKFARNAGNVVNPDENQELSGPNSVDEKNVKANVSGKKFPDRFGLDAPSGTTTIGFGSSSSGNPDGTQTKSVRFSQQTTSFDARLGGPSREKQQVGFKPNESCASDDFSDSDSEDAASLNATNGALFMNAAERKIYLENEFQSITADYSATLKRLENSTRN